VRRFFLLLCEPCGFATDFLSGRSVPGGIPEGGFAGLAVAALALTVAAELASAGFFNLERTDARVARTA
jgi:hypothetical protein